MSSTRERVVAVVVSYNRRDLLVEALEALAAQTRLPDAVVVVDNASTDGSADAARVAAPGADVVALARNTGGAGGFAVGLHRAVAAHRPDWVWLMDDDTIPTPTALAELVDAASASGAAVAGSRVVWHDGSDHPMNTPRARAFDAPERAAAAAAVGAISVRSSSFVSMLVAADAVREAGLPLADYFIWNDDFEFSTRVLRERLGIFVPASVVVHKTAKLGATDVDPGARFRFEVRNKVWMLRRSRSLVAGEKVMYGGSSVMRWARTFAKSAQRDVLRAAFVEGWREGWTTDPRPNSLVLAGLGDAVRGIDGGADG
ncbi:glycosyltransferase family 2 protein [Demequina pelophila]|uniref:glycosyltransferase family 2 protein n=1 Tax=Demequina pelophila TaxID=1638984 RepID=UPI0007851E73|nr:glycosyltransferase family 2 protein [Demequina pelophila]